MKRQFITLAFLWLLFAVAHFFFNKSYLYWYYSWLDILMHLSGGFLFVATWFYLNSKSWLNYFLSKPIFQPMFLLLVVVIGWEFYQLYSSTILKDNYIFDTVTDITFGLIGGLVAFLWYSSRKIEE